MGNMGNMKIYSYIIWLLFCYLIYPAVVTGQTRDTVFATVFTDINVPGASNNIQNIGQNYHQIFVVVESSPPGTCTDSQASDTRLVFEGSFNNVDFITFSSAVKPASTASTGTGGKKFTGMATGVYPYIRVRLLVITVDCRVDVYYTGSKYPLSIPELLNGTAQNTFSMVHGLITGAPDILIQSIAPDEKMAIYGIFITNDSTTGRAVNITEELVNCSGTVVGGVLFTVPLPVENSHNIQINGGPLYRTGAGTVLCVNAIPNTGTASLTIVYKLEPIQ